MAKQLLEFQRVLICVYVCARSSEPPTATQAPPTIHPPASTLLLINLGAHPLRRGGYRQNFVFLLFFCDFAPLFLFYCFLFSSLQFPVLALDYPNWMWMWLSTWVWCMDIDWVLDPRPSPLAPAVGQSDCLHLPGDAMAGALRPPPLRSSLFPWTRANPRHQFNMAA